MEKYESRLTVIALLTFLAMAIGGCASVYPKRFPELKPVSPKLGYMYHSSYPVINTLAPELCWKGKSEQGITYQLRVYEPVMPPLQFDSTKHSFTPPNYNPVPLNKDWRWKTEPVVYEVDSLTDTCHQIPPGKLKPGTMYIWSIRINKSDDDNNWSTFLQSDSKAVVYSEDHIGVPFGFVTPLQ